MKATIKKYRLPFEKKHLEESGWHLQTYFNYIIRRDGALSLRQFKHAINALYGLHFKICEVDSLLFFYSPFEKTIDLETLIGKKKLDYTDMTR